MPTVSIVLPVYNAVVTLGRCLTLLVSQSYRDREIITVDSSPGLACARIIQQQFPEIRLLRSPARLLPHEALNLGIGTARGDLLVFIDPDAYPRQDWLARLVEAHETWGGVIVGGVACYGQRWVDLGAHLCKFDKWLPFRQPGPLGEGPTVNMLVPRDLFDLYGPFPNVPWHADTELCWGMRQAGVTLKLQPAAVVEHHHLHSWRSLLQERAGRGRSFAQRRVVRETPSRSRLLWLAAVSLLPVRLISQLRRTWGNARAAHMCRAFLMAFPVVCSGLYAWLLGEAEVYARAVFWPNAARQ